jgi:hypothetical protein
VILVHCDCGIPLTVQPLGRLTGYVVNVLGEQPAEFMLVTDNNMATSTCAEQLPEEPVDVSDTVGAAGLQAGDGVAVGVRLRLEVTEIVGVRVGLNEVVGLGDALVPQSATTLIADVATGSTPRVTVVVVAVKPMTYVPADNPAGYVSVGAQLAFEPPSSVTPVDTAPVTNMVDSERLKAPPDFNKEPPTHSSYFP